MRWIAVDMIQVHMFRNFSIIYRDIEVLRDMAKSPKSISVLKYLIVNKDKPVPVADLIELFWDEEGGANPENALKTLISRIRKSISRAAPELRACIVTEQSTYQWKPQIPCVVDIFRFEEMCVSLLSVKELREETRIRFEDAIKLYRGNLDAPFVTDEWIKGRGIYYQELYLKTVYSFIDFLKEKGEMREVIQVCRTALNIEAFDEALNLELMYALKETDQNNAALIHYRHSTDMYYKYLGINPSDKILEFYKQLIKSDLEAKGSLDVIRSKLVGEQNPAGEAFICDFSIFKDIYQFQLRNMERSDVRIFLALVMVEHVDKDGEFNPFILDRIMRDLLDILMHCLRKGDTVSRYSSSQYAVLLPMTSLQDGSIIMERIEKRFYELDMESYARIVFQVGPIDQNRILQSS